MTTSRWPRPALALVLVVPFVVALVAAAAGSTGGAGDVRAAVVNEDEIVSVTAEDGTQQPVAVGRLLTAELTADDSSSFDWTITNRADAEDGLDDGTYGAVLVIGADTSAAAVSPAGNPAEVRQAHLRLRTSDATSPLAGELSQTVMDAALAALNAQVTETFVDNVLISLGTMRGSLAEAAEGARTLADGQRELAAGAEQLSHGIGELAAGSGELASGTRALADGTSRSAAGAAQLAQGVGQIDDGAQELRSRTAELPVQTEQLNAGTQQLRSGAEELDAGVREMAASVEPLFDLAQQLTALIGRWSGECAAAGLPPEACAAVDEIAAEAQRVNAEIQAARGRVGELGEGTGRLAEGLRQLSAATAQLAAEAPQLTAGIGQLADGTAAARQGADQLAGGTGRLAGGARAAADGAGELHTGAGRLHTGSGELVAGSGQLSAGGDELAAGLAEGVDQLPAHSAEERERLSQVAARPVTSDSATSHRIAAATLPVPAAIVLGALAAVVLVWTLRAPLARGPLVAGAGLRRLVAGRLIPAAALTLLAMAAVLAGLAATSGLGAASTPRLVALALAGTIALTALGQGLTAAVGRLSAAATALLFAVVTLTTAVPAAAPEGVRLLHAVSPFTPLLDGVRAAQAGTGSLDDVAALAAWGLLGLGLTAWAAYRRRSDVAGWLLRPA